jgi:hypothetical protein
MKTDDYKQELRLSATLCQTNTKKYFGRSKKSTNRLRNSAEFSVVLREMTEIVVPPSCVFKKWPLD